MGLFNILKLFSVSNIVIKRGSYFFLKKITKKVYNKRKRGCAMKAGGAVVIVIGIIIVIIGAILAFQGGMG